MHLKEVLCPSHLGYLSWLTLSAKNACGFLLVLVEPRWVIQSKLLHWRPTRGAMCLVSSGQENTPQCTAAQPQETSYLQTFVRDPYFLFMASFNSGGSGTVCREEKKLLDFCSSHLPPQTHMSYLVMSLMVSKTLLG